MPALVLGHLAPAAKAVGKAVRKGRPWPGTAQFRYAHIGALPLTAVTSGALLLLQVVLKPTT